MYIENKLFRKIWAYYYYFIFGSLLIVLYPLFLIALSRPQWYPYANKLRKLWAALLMPLTGMYYKVNYVGNRFNKNKPYIFCANHTSVLDTPFFGLFLGDKFKFMVKIEFTELPIIGIFFKTVDIPVHRESKLGAYKAFLKAQKSIDEGYSIVIFPEGTTSEFPPKMRDFKNGPFKLAIDKQIPIVPVTFLDNWHMFNYDDGMSCHPGEVRVKVHSPISTIGLNDVDAEQLKNEVYSIIDTDLKQEYGRRQPIS